MKEQPEMRCVRFYDNIVEANAAYTELLAHGIESVVVPDRPTPLTAGRTPARVMVATFAYQDAFEILSRDFF